jgi:predicted permease
VDEELRHHIEMMVEENEARGMSAEQARADALRRFGDLAKITEACVTEDRMAGRRRARSDLGGGILEDLKHGARALRRSPVYAVVIVATLAVSIGAVAVVFSALSPYFLRALPFTDPDRLVHLFTVDAEEGWDKARFSMPQFEDVRERSRSFEELAAYYYGTANLSGEVAAEQIQIGRLTANAFDVLGARALHGRTFDAGEDGPGGADVVVLSHGLWLGRYGGDPTITGKTIRVNGVPHLVIGVMPPAFNFPFGGVKAWVPLHLDGAREARDASNLLVFGRLAAGQTQQSSRAELESIWRQLSAEHPNADGRLTGVTVLSMRPALNFAYDILRAGFIALSGAVVFVLMVACANITGLGLARGAARRGEVAVRAALGASRWRQVRRLLVESTILAGVGGAIGLLIAFIAMRALGPLFPEDLYAVGEFRLDSFSLGGTLMITLVAALLIGILPALNATAVRPGEVLREIGRSSNSQSRRAGRLRAGLIVGELALALVLVVGAGLMARSLEGVSRIPLGFQPSPVLAVELTVPATTYPDAAAYNAFYRRLADAVRALPGIADAGTTAHLPLNHETESVSFGIPGQSLAPENLTTTELFRVSENYFGTMDIAVLTGRPIDGTDDAGSEAVALVNRSLAEKHYGGDATGRTLLIGDLDTLRAVRIIGVVEDVRHSSVTAPPPPQVYLSLAQQAVRRRFLVARAANGDASAIAAAVRTAVTNLDPDVPANLMRPMNAVLNESVGPFAAMSVVLGVFGGFALMLAAIGLYGLIAYSVSQRKAEFGVRLALGAAPVTIVRSVLANGLRLAVLGMAIGLAGAIAAGRVIGSLLFGIDPSDPVTLAIATLVLLITTGLAAIIPATRASRSDPLLALRSD